MSFLHYLPRRALLALLLAAAAATTACARNPASGDDNEFDTSADGRADLSLPAGIRAERDLAYGPDAQQTLDVFIPLRAQRAPIVLMVHGGAWMLGDKAGRGVATNKVARWLPRGVIVVSVNYRRDRRSPNALQQADDVARALAFVQQRAAGWGGDGARVLLMGHSSGAHLVSLLSADPGIAERAGAKPVLGTVALDSAVFDLVEIMERRHYRFYDRVFGKDRQVWLDNSPYHRLQGTPRPMLLVCSSQRSDSCPQADKFSAKAQAAGARVRVLRVPLKHGEINGQLGLAGDYTSQVEDFLRSVGVLQ
ncbi:alpha/beta hydrolase [Rubrivivax sp. RP6-9]|uniref:alpha/beta hydrolase n=1 Tax=Rubrivivax sp. RP6-9 TaxID=3415750 RepID=UPI003CC53438